MSTGSVVARGRRVAESRMLDTFEIRDNIQTEYDPETQADVETYDVLISALRGYIPPPATVLSQSSEVGGRTAIASRREIRAPWDTETIPPNAVAVCTAIGPTTPARMLNKQYRIGGTDGASQGTACHIEILEELS